MVLYVCYIYVCVFYTLTFLIIRLLLLFVIVFVCVHAAHMMIKYYVFTMICLCICVLPIRTAHNVEHLHGNKNVKKKLFIQTHLALKSTNRVNTVYIPWAGIQTHIYKYIQMRRIIDDRIGHVCLCGKFIVNAGNTEHLFFFFSPHK